MTEGGPVLMFGNAEQGTLLHVRDPGQPIMVLHAPKIDWAAREDSPMEMLKPRQVAYAPRRMAIFGVELVLHVEEGLAEERLEAMLVDHLLSDKARAVMRGGPW